MTPSVTPPRDHRTSAGTPKHGGPALIAFVHRGHDWITGAERCLLDLVRFVDPARFRSVVLCNTPSMARAAEELGVPAHIYPDWGPSDPRARRVAFAHVRGLLARIGPSLIHVNMTTPLPAALPFARRTRTPLVAHLHMPLDNRYDRLHEFIHQVDMAVGVAKHVVQPLYDDGMPARRLRTIYNAVDAQRIDAGDATGLRAELGIPTSAFVVLSVGSLIKRKAHDVTVRAVALARAQGRDVRLLVCGTGHGLDDYEANTRALVSELGLDDVVHFLGHRTDVGAIMRDAGDVLAASARAEALPLNVLEAQWAGLPVIASDIPAHHEAIIPGRTGIVVPLENTQALADALVALAADDARRASLREGGRTFAREHFTMERYVGDFEAVYAGLLAQPRRNYGWIRGTTWPREYTRWAGRFVGFRLGLVPPQPME